MGFQWLKNVLEPRGYRLHLADEIYSFAHFDSTIIPLRPGLVLLNDTRVTPQNCPKLFDKWDKIYFSEVPHIETPAIKSKNIITCSPYIGLNILSINENTICVDKDQIPLIKKLESFGIECVRLPMRHARELSGGFHCATLDLVREGPLQDYF